MAAHECCGDCMNRRNFLSAATMSAVAALLAACGDGQIGPAAPAVASQANGASLTVRLADYAALASNGGIARINGSAQPIAVARINATTYRALSLVCPHQGATVNVQASGFLCPAHGARFSTDGTWIGGQQTTSLVVLPSTLDATAGTLTINGSNAPQPKGGGDDDDD